MHLYCVSLPNKPTMNTAELCLTWEKWTTRVVGVWVRGWCVLLETEP